MDEKERPYKVAFLGPAGTYSHQAAYDRFGDAVEYRQSGTISDVFSAVASDIAHAGVVPQENTIFGSVIETYDGLRAQNAGFVRGEVVLEVQHCLLVRRGVKREDIRYIKSHEQALGQCRGFISQNFPSASLEKMASTAAAAEAVLTSSDAAAISSKLCVTVFDGLELLFEGIQDRKRTSLPVFCNFTRFYVLSSAQNAELPLPPTRPTRGLVRLSSQSSPASGIPQLLAALALKVSRLDRRPKLDSPEPFDDIYFAEIERGDSSAPWLPEVEEGIGRVRASGGDAELIGIW
ncbi:PDT-domain-containing protein [Mycena vitilis]|nr:PDT-domain-containing protein [Mycena vitilis]